MSEPGESEGGGGEKERETAKKERTVAEVSLWMWSLKMLKCCVCCEHPSNGKSMMGRALWRSQGCYIKAEVLHQRFAGSKYWCLFGFVGLFKPFSLVSSPFTTGNGAQFPFLPPCSYLRLQAFYSTTLYTWKTPSSRGVGVVVGL